MFPVLTVEVSGLEPDALYVVLMEVCLSSDRRYKFVGAEWKATGRAEPQMAARTRRFIHQDSPATGTSWMREPIKMKAAKLTNNPVNNNGHVSMTVWCMSSHCFNRRDSASESPPPSALSCHEMFLFMSLFCNLRTVTPTPWSRVLLHKLTLPQQVKISLTIHGTRGFITMFTGACHWIPS
jgi:hypothetical protein